MDDFLLPLLGKTPTQLNVVGALDSAQYAIANGEAHWFAGKPMLKDYGVYLGIGPAPENLNFTLIDPDEVKLP